MRRRDFRTRRIFIFKDHTHITAFLVLGQKNEEAHKNPSLAPNICRCGQFSEKRRHSSGARQEHVRELIARKASPESLGGEIYCLNRRVDYCPEDTLRFILLGFEF